MPVELATTLRDRLGLQRAVETGTYGGGGARALADIFEEVVTIELSAQLAGSAAAALSDLPHVQVRHGDSRNLLGTEVRADAPTFYFLDGHWSGGPTAGEAGECPVLDELRALEGSHPMSVVVIDDARLFTAAPPPPHDPSQWPRLMDVLKALERLHPDHHLTVVRDAIVAVPQAGIDLVDAFAHGRLDPPAEAGGARHGVRGVLARLRQATPRRG